MFLGPFNLVRSFVFSFLRFYYTSYLHKYYLDVVVWGREGVATDFGTPEVRVHGALACHDRDVEHKIELMAMLAEIKQRSQSRQL